MDFEYLQGWRLPVSLDNLSLCLVPVIVKKMFPHIQEQLPMFQFLPLALALSLGTTKNCIALLCSVSLGIHTHWYGPHKPTFLFFSEQFQISLPLHHWRDAQIPKHLSGPSLDSMSIPLLYWGAQNLIQYFSCGLNSNWIISNATESISKTRAPKNYEWNPKMNLSFV